MWIWSYKNMFVTFTFFAQGLLILHPEQMLSVPEHTKC